jgi:hypothetical protein
MVHMKRDLVIEWKHIGKDVTSTCERCSLTGGTILDVLENLQPYFRQKNIVARFRETVLPDSQIEESNQVIIDGIPLEEYLSGAEVIRTPCCSCACITGQDEAECRAIDYGGDRYEAITPDLLKQVIIAVVDSGDETCGCGCDCVRNTKCE